MWDNPWLIGIVVGVLIAILAWWLGRQKEQIKSRARLAWSALSPKRHKLLECAIERIAVQLASHINSCDGNGDNEYFFELYNYFTGDPSMEGDTILQRHQSRQDEKSKRRN